MLWGERVFWPAHRDLPEGTVLLSSAEDLGPLAVGQSIAIEGTVYPALAASVDSRWEERFAYRLASFQKNEFGGQQEVVSRHVRPAIRFEWAGGQIVVPAESYGMKSAPEAPNASAFLTNEKNVGFRVGDLALTLGRKTGDGSLVVDELALGPLDVYLQKLESGNTFRSWIGHGLRVVVSLLALSILLSVFRRGESDFKANSSPESG